MLDTDLLDATPLVDTTAIVNALRLKNPSEIYSPENRGSAKRLLRNDDRYRRILLSRV